MRTTIPVLAILVMAGAALPAWARTDPLPEPARESVVEHRCPVMGAVVKDPSTALHSEYKGRTYYFCCPGCKPMFDADPGKYIDRTGTPAKR